LWIAPAAAGDDGSAALTITIPMVKDTTKLLSMIPGIDSGMTLCCSVGQCSVEISARGPTREAEEVNL
jgi:hypothetical protein